MRLKKERDEVLFRIQANIYDGAFLRKQLTAKSFIVDIWSGSKQPSHERNKLFSFQIKAATVLQVFAYPLQNYCYGKTRKVRNSTADIFLEIFKLFGKAISQSSFKPLIVKGFYLLRIPGDYCFRRAVQRQLQQCNRRNTATVLKAVVKSRKDLKGVKVFACWCSGRNLKSFSKFTGKSPCWSCSLEQLIKKSQSKGYRVNCIEKRRCTKTFTQALSCKF